MSEIQRRVLFVCIHNSARSQMAETFLNNYGGNKYTAESAGLEPGKMNPNVVRVMQELGFDLSHKNTQGVSDLIKRGDSYDAIITVCDEASAEQCPVFPGNGKRTGWSFEDPSSFIGTPDEILRQTRRVRDEIEKAVISFIKESSLANYWIEK
jgi:arsenate reductase